MTIPIHPRQATPTQSFTTHDILQIFASLLFLPIRYGRFAYYAISLSISYHDAAEIVFISFPVTRNQIVCIRNHVHLATCRFVSATQPFNV
jgi:hypothetical protein